MSAPVSSRPFFLDLPIAETLLEEGGGSMSKMRLSPGSLRGVRVDEGDPTRTPYLLRTVIPSPHGAVAMQITRIHAFTPMQFLTDTGFLSQLVGVWGGDQVDTVTAIIGSSDMTALIRVPALLLSTFGWCTFLFTGDNCVVQANWPDNTERQSQRYLPADADGNFSVTACVVTTADPGASFPGVGQAKLSIEGVFLRPTSQGQSVGLPVINGGAVNTNTPTVSGVVAQAHQQATALQVGGPSLSAPVDNLLPTDSPGAPSGFQSDPLTGVGVPQFGMVPTPGSTFVDVNGAAWLVMPDGSLRPDPSVGGPAVPGRKVA